MSPFSLPTPSSQHLDINMYYINIFVILSGLFGDTVYVKRVGCLKWEVWECEAYVYLMPERVQKNKPSFLLWIQATPLSRGIARTETRQSMWSMWDHRLKMWLSLWLNKQSIVLWVNHEDIKVSLVSSSFHCKGVLFVHFTLSIIKKNSMNF